MNELSKIKLSNSACYEFFLVITSKFSEEETENLIKKFEDLIKSNGEIKNIDKWGKRKLAYPINKETEGNYVLFNFECSQEFPAELTRITGITDGVLRSLIIKKEETIEEDKKNA